MNIRFAAFALCALLSTNGFAEAEFHPSTYTTYKQHSAYKGDVEVLPALPQDNLNYTEIGLVRISTKQVNNYNQALDQIKAAAARHGGNTIVLEDDAKLFAAGNVTPSGNKPRNVTAVALIHR